MPVHFFSSAGRHALLNNGHLRRLEEIPAVATISPCVALGAFCVCSHRALKNKTGRRNDTSPSLRSLASAFLSALFFITATNGDGVRYLEMFRCKRFLVLYPGGKILLQFVDLLFAPLVEGPFFDSFSSDQSGLSKNLQVLAHGGLADS